MDQEVLQDLYERAKSKGYSKSIEEFQQLISSDSEVLNDNFEYVKSKGYTKDISDFSILVGFGEKKNQVDTPSDVVEEVTESTTETEIIPGSLDSSVEVIDESEEQPYEYLQDDFQELDAIESEPYAFESANSIRARMMSRSQRQINPELKQKILSDYNIQKALENEIITESEIDNAIKGSKDSIKKLQQLSVKTPEEYQAEIDKGDLNNPYAYKNKSDLVEFVSNPEDELKKLEAIQATQSFDAETKKLLDANPDATEEELDAIFNREGAPTEEQYELAEDDFIPTGFEGSEMSNMYNVQALKKVEGFDIKDFDGYLNEQGYKQDYLRLLKDETISEDGRSFDYSGQYNPALAAERLKLQYLTNYINKQVERNVESQVLNYQLKNKGRHPSFDGIQFSFSSGVDDKQLSKFIEEELPIITSKLKQRDVANEELYQDMKNGEVKGVGQGFKQGYRSLEDRINSFSAGTYDLIGMDSVADEIRMSQAETELEREDFMRYTYASGKEKDIDGTTYLVDDKGQVYDKDLGIRVTNVLTPNELQYIQKEVQTKGVNGTSFSTAGMIIQGTGIVTDMMFQIALTRGVGNIGRGGAAFLGAFDRGTKAVNFMSKIPMKATTASAMVAQGTLFSTNLAEQSYKQALDGGMSIAQAEEIQSIAGSQGLVLGVLTAPISTQTYAMDKIFGKNANNVLIQGALKAYEKAGAKGAKAYWTKAALKAKRYLIESGKEVVQENVQQVGQAYVIGDNVNEFAKKEIMANTISGDEFWNTTILSAAAGFFMPFAGNISSNIKTNYNKRFRPGVAAIDRMNALYQLSKDVDKTTKLLNSQVTKRIYTEEQVKRILSDIEVYRETINKIPKGLGAETSLRVMSVISEINKLKSERDGLDADVFSDKVQEIDEDIAFLKNEIIQITRSGAKKVVAKKRPVASPEVEEEVVEEDVFDLSDLESDIKKADKEGTILDNLDKKGYSNGKEGMIRVDKENQNTLVFETNDEIIELGRKDEIGENTLASVDITLMPPEGVDVAPVGTTKGDKPLDVFTIDGVDYTITGRRRDKKGKAVVKVKEVESGLNRRLVGEKAERILKDEALRREKKPQEIKLTTEGKETVKPVVKKKSKKEAQEEYDKKTLAEIEAMEKQSEEDVAAFEEMAVEEAASKSSDRDVVQVGDNIFQVTKKKDGSFAVSQMRDDGKLIPVKDESSRKRPIGVFKSKKSNEERKAITEAERLINEFKSQEQDKILDFLNKAISATSSNGRAFDATLGIPMFAANNSLKIVRASYKAGKTILQAIQDALESLKSQGYNPNEYNYKKYVLNQLKPKQDAIQKPSTEEQVLPDDAGSKKEGGDSKVGLQQVGEGDTQQVTTDTQVEEGKTETDTTSDKTAETDTKQVSILNKSINVTDSRGRKGLVPVSELESFVGENRLGDAAMPNSRETIDKLKEDIKKNGFKEPIVILYDKFSNGGEATIIEGNHRYVAAKELGLKEIPVTFEKGTIRSNEKRAKDQMFPLNRKFIGKINDTRGVKGSDLGLTVRQPTDADFVKDEGMSVKNKTESFAKTNSQTVTADTYKAILASTKSTTNQDMAKPEKENAQRKRFWKAWNQSAREKKMDLKQKRKSLNDGIKAYAKKRKGKITAAQLRAVLNKVNDPDLNLDNPVAVKKVEQYVEKVFSDADFANDVDIANKLKTTATKKLNSGKLGDNGNLNGAVSQIILAPVTDLTPSQLKSYNEFLQKIAKRDKKTKLDRELVLEANDLLNQITPNIQIEQETVQEVKTEKDKKVVEKILNPEISGETIIEENSDFIQNKLDALDSGTLEVLVDKVNAAENENNSELVQELNDYANNRQKLINNTVKKSRNVNLNNLSKISLEQSVGPRTLKGLNKGQLAMLTGKELAELDVYLDNMSEGFYTHFTNNIAQKVVANDRSVNMKPILDKMFTAKGKFSTMRQYAAASVKNGLGKVGLGSSRAAKQVGIRGQMIRSNPLSVIDQMFGNYKNNTIYENAIRPTAQAHARFKNWINGQTDTIETIESLIAPSRTEGINKAVKRRFELTTYLLQLEYESNPNKKGTNPAIKFIEDTIARYNSDKKASKYNKNSIDILNKIAKEYSEDGQISLKKMEDAMSTKTKKALKLLQDVYSGLGELQAYATRIVRGNELDLVNNYVHHKADFKGEERDDANFQNAINFLSLKPGTKSSTSFARSGATAIDFDPITTALRATRNTGMDYFMSNEISTTRQSMAALKNITKNDKSKTNEQQDQLNEAVLDLNKIYSEALNNVVTNNMSSTVLGGKLLNNAKTLGYYSTLASIPRAGAEFASNLAFAALSAPGEFSIGATKYADLSATNKGRAVVENVSSTNNTKLYSDEQLGGSKADSQGVTKKKSSPKARGDVGQTVEYVIRNTGVKYAPKVVSKIGETLVTKPDQYIARPLWFGTFAKTFKAETGSKVDFYKIADNDSDYMNKYKDAIKKATSKADNNVTMAATSNDPFSSVLKNQAQDGESMMNFYRMVNGYMSKFSLNEYATARQAVASMAGQGQLGVVKGASTLAGVTVRMSMYVMLLRYLNGAMFGMLGIGDEDDTDYEELGVRQAVGAVTSLITRGVSGNIPMIPLNYTIESLNKEYGYDVGLRSEEKYNGLENGLVYATINPSNASKNLEEATLLQLSGPFNPYAKTALRVAKLGIRATSNATEESRQENLNKLFSNRTAIEIANMFGGVPFYRDIRKGFLEEEFKEGETVQPFSLDDLKFYDIQEYNRQMRLKEFQKKNKPPKTSDELDIERELKALEKELDNL